VFPVLRGFDSSVAAALESCGKSRDIWCNDPPLGAPRRAHATSKEVPVYAVFAFYLFQSASGFGSLGLMLPVLLIGMVLMTVIPNQRKQKKWNAMLESLKSGDRVTTTGGMRGTILSLRDDVVIVRLAPDNIKLELLKSAIASVTTEDEAEK
jgi:preprotein translocase subunit YajC